MRILMFNTQLNNGSSWTTLGDGEFISMVQHMFITSSIQMVLMLYGNGEVLPATLVVGFY